MFKKHNQKVKRIIQANHSESKERSFLQIKLPKEEHVKRMSQGANVSYIAKKYMGT